MALFVRLFTYPVIEKLNNMREYTTLIYTTVFISCFAKVYGGWHFTIFYTGLAL